MAQKEIIGTEVVNRTGEMRGKVSRKLQDTTIHGSQLYLIEWENGGVSTVWDTDLTEPKLCRRCAAGGWFINHLGLHQVCEQ